MKKILISSLLLTCGCTASNMGHEDIVVQEKGLYETVRILTSTPKPRNFANISSLNLSASYIDSVFKLYSVRVYDEPFSVNGRTYRNIICSFGPENSERIIIGAHYDVCFDQPGADDNASGVAGLLEVARLMSFYKPDLKNRIDLVAFTLEEPPFFRTENMGSAVHAKKLHESGANVKLMISLEMIGYFDERPHSQQFPVGIPGWFYPDAGDFITIVTNMKSSFQGANLKRLMRKHARIGVEQLTAPALIEGVDFSDHLNFWKYGYKAVMLTDTAFLRNPNYHKTTDTIDTLDFSKMPEVIKGLYFALIKM